MAEDSHPLFNLPVPNTKDVIFEDIQKPAFFLGIVTDKQYCMVKKDGTRYRVPVGTKFCRIKVRPVSPNLKFTSDTSSRSTSKRDRSDGKFQNTRLMQFHLFLI